MKELDDNLLNALFHSIVSDELDRDRRNLVEEPELPEDLKRMEDLKRARYEALLEKYKD